jgi:hypothetical protein
MSFFNMRLVAFAIMSLLMACAIYSSELRNYVPVALAGMQLPFFSPSSDISSDRSYKLGSKVLFEGINRRIVAVGDIHGGFDNAFKVLHMAGVVDDQGDWTGNVDLFVQTGDIIDR